MSTTGWYPDPGGTPGRYRYWDGNRWSDEMTDDPAQPPPVPGGRPHPTTARRNPGAAIGIAALVLVIVVVSAVMIIRRNDAAGLVDPTPPTSTMTGWDDSSPLPTAEGSPSPSGRGDWQTCPDGDPAATALHPQDGRVHGGRLSMPRIDGYSDPAPQYMLSWMYDTSGMEQTTEPGWISLFAVGEIHRMSDFGSARRAARSSMQCAIDTSWYLHVTGRKDIRDEAITIDGNPGWILSTEVRVDDPDVATAGDRLTFVVVDDGRPDALSVWCGMVPLDDPERLALHDRILADLQIAD